MSHWHTIEFPQDALLIKFLIWRFSELFFHVFFLYYHFKTFSNDFLMNNFISNDSIFLIAHNCNYLILCHRSFICKAHVHDSTTQVSPPFQVSFLFLRFHFSLTLSLHHPFSFHDQFHGQHEQLSAVHSCHCLSVCQSACRSVCLSVSLSTEDWNVASVLWVRTTKSRSSLVVFFAAKVCIFEQLKVTYRAGMQIRYWASERANFKLRAGERAGEHVVRRAIFFARTQRQIYK